MNVENIEANSMKLLIIKCAYPMKSDGLKKYEDEFNRMIRENGYLILPSGFETEVVDVSIPYGLMTVATPSPWTSTPSRTENKCDISDCMWNFKGKCSINSTGCLKKEKK